MTVNHLLHFLINHWILVILFILTAILILILEIRDQSSDKKDLTPQQAIQLINREKAIIIDIRPEKSFKEGHIVNAINIPYDEWDKQLKRLEKQKKRPLVIVCNMGRTATKLKHQLTKQQFQKVHVIRGGMSAWHQANLPITKK